MDTAAAIMSQMIHPAVVGRQPKVSMSVAGDSRHTIRTDRVLLNRATPHVFKTGRHVGHHQYAFPVDSDPCIAIAVHNGILHVRRSQVIFIRTDIALRNNSGGFIIDFQPVTVGRYQYLSFQSGIYGSHHITAAFRKNIIKTIFFFGITQ